MLIEGVENRGDVVSNSYNPLPTLRRCVALKFAFVSRPVYGVTSPLRHLISSLLSMQAPATQVTRVTSFRFNIFNYSFPL